MAADDDAFLQILAWLAGKQDILAERVIDGTVDEDVYGAATRHGQLDEHLVAKMAEEKWSGRIDGRRPRCSVWLEPVTRGDLAVPMLSPHWDFRNADARTVQLYVGLYFRDEKSEMVDGIGFRYEAPHGSGDIVGRHDYFHAQPITDFANGAGRALPVQERSQPESTPAFPLEAGSFAQLLVCLLISLYGGTYVSTLEQSGIEGMGAVLAKLTCCRRAT